MKRLFYILTLCLILAGCGGGSAPDANAAVLMIEASGAKTAKSTLPAAITAAGSTKYTIQYSTDQTLSANLTVPANIELAPVNGASIGVPGGATFTNNGVSRDLSFTGAGSVVMNGAAVYSSGTFANTGSVTINGPLTAGRYLMFPGGGTVTIAGPTDAAYPEWFGYSATENAAFINKALRAVNGKAPVVLDSVTYNTIQSVVIAKNDTILGLSPDLSHIRQSGAAGATVYAITTNLADLGADPYFYNINLKNFVVTGGVGADAHTPDRTINLDTVGLSNVENVKIYNGKRCLYIRAGLYNNFKKVKAYGGSLTGVSITYGTFSTTTQVFDHCYFSGHSSNPMTNGIVLAASVAGTNANVLGTVFKNCIIESTTSSAIVLGRGADAAFENLYTENCVMDPLSTDPIIDLWTLGVDSAFDYNNRVSFSGTGTINGSSEANPQSVAFKVGHVSVINLRWHIIGRVLDMFSFVDTSYVPVGTIHLSDNVYAYNRAFVVDAATYDALVIDAHKIQGEIPISYDSLTRTRYTTGNRFLGEYYTLPDRAGKVNLVGGTATVSTTYVTANSIIILTNNANGGTPGVLRAGSVVAGTSFVITSSSGSDTSTVGWMIFEPVP